MGVHTMPDCLEIGPPANRTIRHRRPNRTLLAGWLGGLAFLGLLLSVRPVCVQWVWMWLMVATLLLWVKLLMLVRLRPEVRTQVTGFRLAGYFVLWPGTRPEPFLRPGPAPADTRLPIWLGGLFHVTTGALILWLALPWLARSLPAWAVACLGMVGLSLLVHFGLFDLLASAWRAVGVPVEKVFQNPVAATSLTDFWGERWNRAFSAFGRELLLRPLAHRFGLRAAGLVVFLVSGLLHELVITIPAGGGYGGPTLYFLLQGLLSQVEGLRPVRALLRRCPFLGWLWTALVVLLPVPLLFPPVFLQEVIIPFLEVLRAVR
jgi:hypothetical protein